MAGVYGIDSFKANFAGGARGALFRVDMDWPGATDASRLEFHCKGASLPASTVETIPVPFRGRDLKISGKRTFENWQITVINDQDMAIRSQMESWSHKMTEHGVFYSEYEGIGSFADYMVDAKITQLDMQHQDIRSYTMIGCWPTSISAITVGSGEDGIEEFTVDLAYQYWEVDKSTIDGRSQAIKDSDGIAFGNVFNNPGE